MTRELSLNADTDRLAWRKQLMGEIQPGDEIVLHVIEPISFTHLRQLVTSLNTIAWQRGATLRYDNDSAATTPPLPIRYSRPPSITKPKM